MSLTLQISRYMSLREPQYEALDLFRAVSEGTDYKTFRPELVAENATAKAHKQEPIVFDTAFPSFCFALATGVGKTRLMGASIYYLWNTSLASGRRHILGFSESGTETASRSRTNGAKTKN